MSTLTTLSPEARLLLLTAGGAQNDSAIHQLLERELDWTRVLAIAERERAVWPLWQRIGRIAPKRAPPVAADQLQRLAMVAEFRLRMLEQRLGESLAVLENAGIDVLLFKGAALAPMVYGDFVLRPMGDLDLLLA